MTKIAFKPCFALEALGTLIFSQYYREDLAPAKDWVINNLSMYNVPAGNGPFSILVAKMSFEEIEKLSESDFSQILAEVFDKEFEDAPWHDDLLAGLRALKAEGFAKIWSTILYPILDQSCREFDRIVGEDTKEAVIRDVCRVRGVASFPKVNVFITHFSDGISFQLTGSSFLTSTRSLDMVYFTKLIAHELSHGFSTETTRNAYRRACETDPFLKETRKFLFNVIGSPSDEEEFVQAIDRFICVKNGVRKREEVVKSLSGEYRFSIPLTVIIFNELCELPDIPKDINEWITTALSDGTVKIGNVAE